MTPVNCGDSLAGPGHTSAPAHRWLAVWQATVSWTYRRHRKRLEFLRRA
jgi:hypothetical protein